MSKTFDRYLRCHAWIFSNDTSSIFYITFFSKSNKYFGQVKIIYNNSSITNLSSYASKTLLDYIYRIECVRIPLRNRHKDHKNTRNVD